MQRVRARVLVLAQQQLLLELQLRLLLGAVLLRALRLRCGCSEIGRAVRDAKAAWPDHTLGHDSSAVSESSGRLVGVAWDALWTPECGGVVWYGVVGVVWCGVVVVCGSVVRVYRLLHAKAAFMAVRFSHGR